MDLATILKQPDGFTPPDVTVSIEKVFPYKTGESAQGPWSFQDVQVTGGKLKLKGLPEFPSTRVGQTVTIRANQSKQHGLTGMKVAHEEYNGNIYDKLIITNSAKWEWGSNGNGASAPSAGQQAVSHGPVVVPDVSQASVYGDHILACASLAAAVAHGAAMSDDQAIQACFATIVIDTKNRNILLPKSSNNGHTEKPAEPVEEDDEPPF